MIRKRDDLSIRRQCELLRVNRSGLYVTPKQPDDTARLLREEIMGRIDYWHTQLPAMGSRKIVVKLQDEGYSVGRKYIRNCMEEMGIHAVYPKPNLSKRNYREAIVPYLLRNYPVCFPNQVWSIDITYIKMHHGHMYLTAIIDWFSRKIIGWKLSDTLDTSEVIAAVRGATQTSGIPAIMNSDQGCQFTNGEYKQLMKELGIRQSMDGKSRWADNIMIERWFRSLKTELIYCNEFGSPRELRKAIRDYIESYNTLRPHEALGYETPQSVYGRFFPAA